MRYVYRRAAGADISDAYAWYERERQGLGEEFLQAVGETVRFIVERPEAYPIFHRKTRRALVHRFPYGLLYRVIEDTVVFVGCLHTSRDPAEWKRRR